MRANNLYLIADCNEAGKTKASHTIYLKLLDIENFENTDEMAKGFSTT